ncbi:MAG: hypothetical protein KBT45_09435 [Bacteroidales bacterium]|nr:hypothetical protein [Candidatus Colimorpha pelethequi]
MANYNFNISRDEKKPEWWIVSVRYYPGFELRFKNRKFNTTKQLNFPSTLELDRIEAEEILRQMIKWLTVNYYDILQDATIPTVKIPLSEQFEEALRLSGMDEVELGEKITCKASRLRHLTKGLYHTINLETFLKAIDALGYEFSIHRKISEAEDESANTQPTD